jgi:hypothetical protein
MYNYFIYYLKNMQDKNQIKIVTYENDSFLVEDLVNECQILSSENDNDLVDLIDQNEISNDFYLL